MKLLPILMLGLAPNAVLQEASPKPAEVPAEVKKAAEEASAELKLAGEEAKEALQNAKETLQDPKEILATPVQEPEIPQLLDVQEVDPDEFAAPIIEEAEPIGMPVEATMLESDIDDLDEAEAFYFEDDPTVEFEVVEQSEADVAGSSHAPIGVPLSLQVGTDQFGMVLRGSRSQYDGLRDSRDDLSAAENFARGYEISPEERTDDMLELEAYFGLNERWDLYAVLPFLARDLDYDANVGLAGDIDTSGLGDVQLGAIFRSYDVEQTRLSYLVGLSIPTGSIDERGDYAGAPNTKLPYDLQLGSGTFDLVPAVLYESATNDILWGARAAGRIHLESENDEGWFRSNSMRLDLWAGKRFADDWKGTVRMQGDWWGDLHNFDPELDPVQSPGEDSLRQGGSRVNLYGGMSYDFDHDRTNRLELEIGAPVEEWLDGPQLSQELNIVLGWRVNF